MEFRLPAAIDEHVGTTGIIQQLRSDIQAGGFNVVSLVADRSSCDWAYSVGLKSTRDHPELLLIGLEATFAGMVVEHLSRVVLDGMRIRPGQVVYAADVLRLETCMVDQLWLAQGAWFDLGREVVAGWGQRWPETIQLLWSDSNGRYPTVPGDPEWMTTQPLLSSAPRPTRADLTT